MNATSRMMSSSGSWLRLPNLQQGYLGSAPRRTRVACTVALCVPAASYLVATEFFGDVRDASHAAWRLVALMVRIVVVHPIFEHIGHRLLHRLDNGQHRAHHVEIHANHAGADEFEWWCYAAALLAYCASQYTRIASLGLLQYAWFHQMSHDCPLLVPRIARHHAIHHLSPAHNHCISFSWPDVLFGTHLSSQPRAVDLPARLKPMLDGQVPPCFATERRVVPGAPRPLPPWLGDAANPKDEAATPEGEAVTRSKDE